MKYKIMSIILIGLGLFEIIPPPHTRFFDIMGGFFIGFGLLANIIIRKSEKVRGEK